MALRVLLADESSTIKKVFQLALQDFAVEVKSVNMGVDVIPVANEFQPDIVFADVLLQKRNGYDVCLDLKSNADLKDVPVVLMWSGFMDIDEDKYHSSQANGHLEKPFDVNGLRKVIQSLVPKTKTQNLSRFLKHPDVKAEELTAPNGDQGEELPIIPMAHPEASVASPRLDEAPPVPSAASSSSENWTMENFEPIDEFQAHTNEFTEAALPTTPPELVRNDSASESVLDEDPADQQGWEAQPISRFQVPVEQQELDEDLDHVTVDYALNEDPVNKGDFIVKGQSQTEDDDSELELDLTQSALKQPEQQPAASEAPSMAPQLSADEMERIIRAQSQAVIEEVVWKIVPDLAKRVIERELERLLQEKFPESE